ncbi:hypothetical protein ADK90_19910 [Streptomyces sp. XY413]|nr:hypothetical protein ADK90_19910 [Streptomyces sp. XY413]
MWMLRMVKAPCQRLRGWWGSEVGFGRVGQSLGGGCAADALERGGDLAGEDPESAAWSLGKLRQCLKVLVGQQLGVGVVAVNGLEHLVDGSGLALGPDGLGRSVPFGAQYGRLLVPFGGQDLRLPLSLSSQDRGALVPLRSHLLLHRVLDRLWRIDGFDLHAVGPQAPFARGVVQDAAELAVDGVARGEGLLLLPVPLAGLTVFLRSFPTRLRRAARAIGFTTGGGLLWLAIGLSRPTPTPFPTPA